MSMSARKQPWLSSPSNPYYRYDLLGLLKSEILGEIYVEPTATECPDVSDAVALALRCAAVPAYPYLGDVAESPTIYERLEHVHLVFVVDFSDGLFQLVQGEMIYAIHVTRSQGKSGNTCWERFSGDGHDMRQIPLSISN